jgi:hypothetical protein
MALIPLNTFKTKTALLTTNTSAAIYTAPIGVTSIILMAQVSNISTQTQYVTCKHFRNRRVLSDAQGLGGQPANTESILVNEFPIPKNDAASLITGKLIIEELDSVRAHALTSGTCQIVLSILETANE